MKYITTPLEDSIQKLYYKIGVREPDYPITGIAEKLGVTINYWKVPLSMPGSITLNPFHSKGKQKEVFSHELGHELNHVGIQLNMPEDFRLMQEDKARNFALHFAVPTFMLQKIDMPKYRNIAVELIAETFCVTYEFAAERLTLYEKHIFGSIFHECLMKCNEVAAGYTPNRKNYSDKRKE